MPKEILVRMSAACAKGEITERDISLYEGSGAVRMQENGRMSLMVWSRWMNVASAADRKLCLIHEAGHITLRHVERTLRIVNEATEPEVRAAIMAVNGWAIDFAVNDAIVRLEPEFEQVHKKRVKGPDGKSRLEDRGEWHFLVPEEYDLPVGQSYETYLHLMLDNLEAIAKKADELLESMLKEMEKEAGEDEGEGGGEGEGESEGGEGDGEGEGGQPGSGPGKPGGKGGKPGKSGKPGDEEIDEDSMAGAAARIRKLMAKNPEKYQKLFEKLAKAHEKLTGHKHEQWGQVAAAMSHEEALSIAEKLKKQAKAMVSKAWDESPRTRGLLPAGVQKMVAQLMAPSRIPWHLLFRDIVAASVQSRLIEEMVVPNLMLLNEDHVEPWPGMALDQSFNVTFMQDTSGSVSDVEFARACKEINAIMAVNKSMKLTVIMVDAAIQSERVVETVEPLSDADKRAFLMRRGYGGTVYSPAFRRVLNIDTASDWQDGTRPEMPHATPDLMIVFSDGGVCLQGEVFPQYKPPCGIIWLLAPGCHAPPGMDSVSPNRLIQMHEVKGEFEG